MKSSFAIRAALLGGVFMLSSSGIFGRLAGAPPSVTAFYRLLFAVLDQRIKSDPSFELFYLSV